MRQADRDAALEIIKGMTKAEIIGWLSSEVGFLFRPPSKSQLFYGRWKAASDAVAERRERNKLDPSVVKSIDKLNQDFVNADISGMNKIAEQLEPLQKIWKNWIAEIQAINKEDCRVDKMWDEYMKESESESLGVVNLKQGEK